MGANHYFRNRIYCDIKFKELVNWLSGFFIHNEYIVYNDSIYRHFIYSDMHLHNSEAYVISAPARFIFDEYNGILFRVENLRRKIALGEIQYENLPIAIRQRFPICPNFIEIDTFMKLYSLQKEIGKELENWFLSKGRKAYIRNFEGEYLDIIETAYDDPSEKAEEFHKLLQEFLPTDEIKEFDLSRFPKDFIWLIPQMHPDTITVLKTAEILSSALSDLPDSSAIIIEYCKAVEIELSEKLLRPARNHWASLSITLPLLTPKELDKLKKYLLGHSPRPLELGTMAVILEAATYNITNPIANSLIESFKNLPFSYNSPLELVHDILYLTQNFRNPAAHKSILSKKQAEECRDFVIGTNSKPGLLFRILKV